MVSEDKLCRPIPFYNNIFKLPNLMDQINRIYPREGIEKFHCTQAFITYFIIFFFTHHIKNFYLDSKKY